MSCLEYTIEVQQLLKNITEKLKHAQRQDEWHKLLMYPITSFKIYEYTSPTLPPAQLQWITLKQNLTVTEFHLYLSKRAELFFNKTTIPLSHLNFSKSLNIINYPINIQSFPTVS